MGNTKQINIKNRTYYFSNDMINIENFDPSLIKIDKNHTKTLSTYNIGYITIKRISDYENINGVNLLYLIISKVDGHIEENNGNKYLTFASSEKNKKNVRKVYKSLG